ncbi:hypothetical protein NA57DRAFT_60146 [Rhizodiscina lignyota]|uniref:BTB domain-containing protein n=1 Tax=Rhizodiscina lignyota TaxID=1504668 RepID=A0A9P4I777_9PEZI|nr:hypothetical protein NA57DRAFT_60146 [Rhizodiscina lignyota]
MDQRPVQSPLLTNNPHNGIILTGGVIQLLIGPEKHSFLVHESVLRKSSTFFRNRLKEEWRRKKANKPHEIINLPHEKKDVVELYLQWLYSEQSIHYIRTSPADDRRDPSRLHDAREFRLLYGLYCFANMVQDRHAKNATIKGFIDRIIISKSFPSDLAESLVTDGLESSPLWRLLVDMYAYFGSRDCVPIATHGQPRDWNHAPVQFWKDVLEVTWKMHASCNHSQYCPWEEDPKWYYERTEDDQVASSGRG